MYLLDDPVPSENCLLASLANLWYDPSFCKNGMQNQITIMNQASTPIFHCVWSTAKLLKLSL